ncbi:MAG: hypothetical protein N4A54_04135 [Peptostreptococcaceae bacterium]|jgi:arginyl-tRNA--protein-N-Asp/Glu arginylyltransferase|nr:hypothetical protein [Peptostreptococcaceae bacterium]
MEIKDNIEELSEGEKQILAFSLFDRYIDNRHHNEDAYTETIKDLIYKIELDKYLPNQFESNRELLYNKLNLSKEYNYLKDKLDSKNHIIVILCFINLILSVLNFIK